MYKVQSIEEIFSFTDKSSNDDVLFIIKDLKLKLDYKKIHIVGTNGKGSTCKYLSDNFTNHKISNGSFTSPHLLDVKERISLNSKAINKIELLEIINFLLENYSNKKLNFFSLIFLSSLIFFERKKPKIVIFEAGIGAKKDVVNILDFDFTIFTSISIDHQEILGKNIRKITSDKAHAIKSGSKIYFPSNLKLIAKIILFLRLKKTKNIFIKVKLSRKEKNIFLNNFTVVKTFLKNEFKINAEMTESIKGRMSLKKINNYNCYFDVSHNYDGIKKTLSLLPKSNTIFIVSLTIRNDFKKIMSLFDCKKTFVFQNSSKKAIKIDDYPSSFKVVNDLKLFIKNVNSQTIFIGSHYFINDVYKILKDDYED